MTISVPAVTLNNQVSMPQLGFGVWQVPNDQAKESVLHALRSGYRSIDTAAIYGNEEGVGSAIAEFLAESGVDRSELFITTKLWNAEQGFESTLKAFDESLAKLGLDYVDLYLIHWPTPEHGKYVDTWKAFEDVYAQGRAKAIGVSNFKQNHIQELIDLGGTVPAVNQVELHPQFQQEEFQKSLDSLGIKTEAWSPLGQGTLLENPTIVEIAEQHGKTPAQVIIRWHIQSGRIVIPKSVTPSRIESNLDVFDFELSPEQISAISDLHTGERIGPDPDEFN